MTCTIEYTGEADEALAIEAFLRWQNTTSTLSSVPVSCLFQHTKGLRKPVVFSKDKVIAVGFKQLYKYWEQQGLFLC